MAGWTVRVWTRTSNHSARVPPAVAVAVGEAGDEVADRVRVVKVGPLVLDPAAGPVSRLFFER